MRYGRQRYDGRLKNEMATDALYSPFFELQELIIKCNLSQLLLVYFKF